MGRDIITIGASAGGIEALLRLLPSIDPKIDAAICIVIHMSPRSPGMVPAILQRATALEVKAAEDGEPIRHGVVFVPPPDNHLRITSSGIKLSRGPHENRSRPSIDVLFRSAAVHFGQRVIGVILTGQLSDGADGLRAICESGGEGIIQDPSEAVYPEMPRNAAERAPGSHVARLDQIGELVMKLVNGSSRNAPAASDELIREERAVELGAGEGPRATVEDDVTATSQASSNGNG